MRWRGHAPFACFAYTLSQRVPLGLDVIRDRKALFRERAGRIENVYTLKVLNMDERPRGDPRIGPVGGRATEAEAGAVVEIPVPLMAEGVAPRIPQHARHVRPHRQPTMTGSPPNPSTPWYRAGS